MLRPFLVTENHSSSLVSFSFTVSFRDKSKQVMPCFFQSLFLFAINFPKAQVLVFLWTVLWEWVTYFVYVLGVLGINVCLKILEKGLQDFNKYIWLLEGIYFPYWSNKDSRNQPWIGKIKNLFETSSGHILKQCQNQSWNIINVFGRSIHISTNDPISFFFVSE